MGDSLLDLIVVEFLYQYHEGKDEGTLTLLKQAGVSNKALGMIALKYGMHELILMEHVDNDTAMRHFQKILKNFDFFLQQPEEITRQKISSIKILGDVFEALVGAIFIDNGMDYAITKKIVMEIIGEFLMHFTDLENLKKTGNYRFQKYLESNNYRKCEVKKDTTKEIIDGKFRYILTDKMGNFIDDCEAVSEKKAWDALIEKFEEKQVKV